MRYFCELLLKEIKMGNNEEGITTLRIAYYFSKDWIKNDSKFELLSGIGIHYPQTREKGVNRLVPINRG